MIPSLHTDAQPPVGDHTKVIFLAGAIKYWWLWECDICGDLQESDKGECPKSDCDGWYSELWGCDFHKAYLKWRDDVRHALIDLGYLTYAPHEAFKGTWHEKAQAVNDAGIAMSDLMLVLSPPNIPTEGTDDEVLYAKRVDTPILYAEPSMGIAALLRALDEMFPET